MGAPSNNVELKNIAKAEIWYSTDCNDKNPEDFVHGIFSVPMTQCPTAKKVAVYRILSKMTSEIDFVQKYGQSICYETVGPIWKRIKHIIR